MKTNLLRKTARFCFLLYFIFSPFVLAEDSPVVQDASAYELKAQSLLDSGKLIEAMAVAQEAIKINPNSAEAYATLTGIHQAKGNWIAGLDAFKKTKELNPNIPRSYFYYGRLLLDQGLFDDAAEQFKKVEELDPNYPDTHLYRGLALGNQGDHMREIEELTKASQVTKNKSVAFQSLAKVHLERKDLSSALEFIEKAIHESPKNAENYFLKGKIDKSLKRTKEAIQAFEMAIGLQNDYTDVYKELGPLYVEKGDWRRAANAYENMGAESQGAYHFSELGFYYQKSEEYDKAIEAYEKAIVLDPDDANNYFNIGIVYKLKKDWNNSILSYQKAIEISPAEPEFYYGLAHALCGSGDYLQARAAANQSVTLGFNKAAELVAYISKSHCGNSDV